MSCCTITLDVGKLEGLEADLKANSRSYVKVGILAKNAGRRDGSLLNNPTRGLIHEVGSFSRNIPERSFLVMPLRMKLGQALKKLGDPAVWNKLLVDFGFAILFDVIGNEAVGVILEAFATGGFGQWPQLSPWTVRQKGNADILIDTGEMRGAISYEVVARGPRKKATP